MDKSWRDLGTELNASWDLECLRYYHSFLPFYETSEMPIMSGINHFKVGVRGARLMEPASIISMAAKMPNLEHINWVVCDNEKRDLQLAKSNR